VTKKVPGVWDYGFGSILHYIKYIEAHENRGNVTRFQALDKNQWNLTGDSATRYQTNNIKLGAVKGAYGTYYDGLNSGYNVKLYKQGVIKEYSYDSWHAALNSGMQNLWSGDNSSKDPTSSSFDTSRVYPLPDTQAYMIDWAVTPAGTISNKIETSWKNSGKPFNCTESETFTNGTINAMTIEHFTDGKATFKWDSSCINTSNGTYTNPRANLYLVRYEPTGNSQVDGKYSYTAYDDNGTEKYYLRIAIISMFNSDDTCKACGKEAIEKVYKARDHSSCYRSYQVKIKDSYDDVTGTWQYKTYNSWKNKPLKVDSKTGDVTQNPYIKVPEYWDSTLNDGAGGWAGSTTRYNLINSSGNCRYCGKSASYVSSY
jgi:hypothetical protein